VLAKQISFATGAAAGAAAMARGRPANRPGLGGSSGGGGGGGVAPCASGHLTPASSLAAASHSSLGSGGGTCWSPNAQMPLISEDACWSRSVM
jgi:hypothetical protein